MSELPPIFIVGTSRSGTSLLASMIGAHPQVACGPETALLLHLPGNERRIYDDPAWPEEAVRFLTGLQRLSAQGTVLSHFDLAPETVAAELAARPPSFRALMESITVSHMRAQGKTRWAEKTPRHIWHLRLLRDTWPDAPIVRIIRDPRGVAASARDWPFGWTATRAAYQWRLDEGQWNTFAHRDARTATLRYEDLLAEPETTLRRLCAAIDLPYDDAMVAVGSRARVVVENEPWHALVGRDVQPDRASAWRDVLSPDEADLIATVCAREMQRHGYAGARAPRQWVALHPWDRRLLRFQDVLEELSARRIVARPLAGTSTGRQTPILFVGERGQLQWVRGRHKASTFARWCMRLLITRLQRQPIVWIERDMERERSASRLDRLGDALVRGLRTASTARPLLAVATRSDPAPTPSTPVEPAD